MVLWGSILPSVWDCGRIHRSAPELAVPLPENVPMEQGACLGIPGITAYGAVHVAGSFEGAPSWCKAARARLECALFSSRIERERGLSPLAALKPTSIASRAGADEVLLADEKLVRRIKALAPDGVNHIVEVAFAANINTDVAVLAQGGSSRPTQQTLPHRKFPSGSSSSSTPEFSLSAATMCQLTQRWKPGATSIGRLRQDGRAWKSPSSFH